MRLGSGFTDPFAEPAPECAAVLTSAERPFTTPSTVERHLTRIFRKPGVKQREELPLVPGFHSAEAC
ncbi:hypothetical protein CTZ27_02045 [Streptomyces griseocarneus]|nr:hypothetical protein CTZ27_02045 [Streptomyces griseocarneus]